MIDSFIQVFLELLTYTRPRQGDLDRGEGRQRPCSWGLPLQQRRQIGEKPCWIQQGPRRGEEGTSLGLGVQEGFLGEEAFKQLT